MFKTVAKEISTVSVQISLGVLPFRLIFTVRFKVTVCLGLGMGLGIELGSGLGELGLGEMGQNLSLSDNVYVGHHKSLSLHV